jgi:hypothetical protein
MPETLVEVIDLSLRMEHSVMKRSLEVAIAESQGNTARLRF